LWQKTKKGAMDADDQNPPKVQPFSNSVDEEEEDDTCEIIDLCSSTDKDDEIVDLTNKKDSSDVSTKSAYSAKKAKSDSSWMDAHDGPDHGSNTNNANHKKNYVLKDQNKKVVNVCRVDRHNESGVQDMKKIPAKPSPPTGNFFVVSSDLVVLTEKCVRFTIRGRPCVLERPRFNTKTGHVYSPSARNMTCFRSVAKEVIPAFPFAREEWLCVHIRIREKCPTTRKEVACAFGKGHGDIDNYAKFVLDSLNGVVYHDDKQVVVLHVARVYGEDNIGAIDIVVTTARKDDIERFWGDSGS